MCDTRKKKLPLRGGGRGGLTIARSADEDGTTEVKYAQPPAYAYQAVADGHFKNRRTKRTFGI